MVPSPGAPFAIAIQPLTTTSDCASTANVSPTFAVEDEMGFVTATVIGVPPGTTIFCPFDAAAGIAANANGKQTNAMVAYFNMNKTSEAGKPRALSNNVAQEVKTKIGVVLLRRAARPTVATAQRRPGGRSFAT
jgi:hypothetical protein